MGAGRKTQTLTRNERNERILSFPTRVNTSVSARNLRKGDLGGVIFGCKHQTMTECLSKQLFGLPAQHFSYVKNIEPGLPLFLFNYSDRKLHGVFESASSGKMNINPYAWTENGSERTQYPSQVLIRIRTQCQPLQEMQFRPIICDNFYTSSHFWFELDHAQVDSLVVLFTATCNSGARISPPYNLPNRRRSIGNANITSVPSTRMNLFVGSKEGPKKSAKQGLANQFEAINPPNNLPNRRPSIGNANSTSVPSTRMNLFVGSKVGPKPSAKQGLANRFEALGWEDLANNDSGSCSVSSSIGYDGNLNLSEFPDLNPTSKNIGCSSTSPCFDGDTIALEAHEEIWENDEEIDELMVGMQLMQALKSFQME